MKLSILIPVYNERYVVAELVHQVLAAPLPDKMDRELIIVDDGSTDGTPPMLERLAAEHSEIVYRSHAKNQGKGAAIRTAIGLATGDFCIFQDADLEYDPRDYQIILEPLLSGQADVVYGSRFLFRRHRRVLYFWHTLGNKILTLLSNMLTDLNLTDMETCYKAFRTELLKTIPIRSNDFGVEPEITTKVAKRGFRIYEVPINYYGRTYAEGKKITWKDGVRALWVLLKFHVVDDLYDEHAGGDILASLSKAHRFNRWIADKIRPHVGHRIMEVGAGIGNLTLQFLPRNHYIASEYDELHLGILKNLALRRPGLEVAWLDVQDRKCFEPFANKVDTLLCLNVLEHVPDSEAALGNFFSVLEPGGRAIIVVPQGVWLYGELDDALDHVKRYKKKELKETLEKIGFHVEKLVDFNKIGVIGWFLNGKLLHRTRLPKFQLKLYDSLVWLWRLIDWMLPWHGLSLVAVARKPRLPEP